MGCSGLCYTMLNLPWGGQTWFCLHHLPALSLCFSFPPEWTIGSRNESSVSGWQWCECGKESEDSERDITRPHLQPCPVINSITNDRTKEPEKVNSKIKNKQVETGKLHVKFIDFSAQLLEDILSRNWKFYWRCVQQCYRRHTSGMTFITFPAQLSIHSPKEFHFRGTEDGTSVEEPTYFTGEGGKKTGGL